MTFIRKNDLNRISKIWDNTAKHTEKIGLFFRKGLLYSFSKIILIIIGIIVIIISSILFFLSSLICGEKK